MQSEVLQLRSVVWLLEGMGLKNRGENALQYHAMNFKHTVDARASWLCLLVGRIRRPHIVARKCQSRSWHSKPYSLYWRFFYTPSSIPDGDFIAGSVLDQDGVRK